MIKHHAKHKKHHETSTREEVRLEEARQAGFLSFNFKKFMNRRDKFLVISIALGVVILFAGSTYLILSNRSSDTAIDSEGVDAVAKQQAVNEQIDEMIAEVKDTTVIINPRAINPSTVTIKVGGSVGFFNETSEPVTIRPYDGASEIINVGVVAPFDIPVVVFDKAGTFRYINPQNPQDVAEIVVNE